MVKVLPYFIRVAPSISVINSYPGLLYSVASSNFNFHHSVGAIVVPAVRVNQLSLNSCSNRFWFRAVAETMASGLASPSTGTGIKRALISVSDKTNLASFASGLESLGYTIISTGGTATALENGGVAVTKVEKLTDFPDMARS